MPVLAPDELPAGLRGIITFALLSATLMEVVDTSIVNVALPNMQGRLGVTLDQVSWVSTGYIIANVIVLPLTAWLSDLFGRKRYLGYSLILFTLASLGCGLSSTLPELVAFRILQGAGGAAFLSTSQATLLEIYPARLRGMAQAIFGIGVMMAPTIGPTIGGYLTDHFSWQWIFFVNLPLGALATVLTLSFVPDSKSSGQKRAADLPGIALLALGLGSLQTVLERGETESWFETRYIVGLSIAAVLGVCAFAYWELRPGTKNPAVDLRLLGDRNLLIGCLYATILGFLLYGSVFSFPQFVQVIQGHTAQQTGLLLMPGGLATALGMAIVGRTVEKLDARILVGGGMLAYLASSILLSNVMTLGTPDGRYFWPLVLRGLGFGLAFVPLSLVALGNLRPQSVSQGAGLYNLFRQLGGSFGIAALATVLDRREHLHFARLADHVSATSPLVAARLAVTGARVTGRVGDAVGASQGALALLRATVVKQAYALAFGDVFLGLAAMAAVGVALVFLFRKAQRKAAVAIH